MYTPHFIYLFIYQWTHLGCFHPLAIVNKAATNIGVQITLQDPAFNSKYVINKYNLFLVL